MRRSRESIAQLITVLGLYACAAYASYRLIVGARNPHHFDGYRYRNVEAPILWDYPTNEVARWVFAIVLQAVGASLIVLRSKGITGGICLLLATVAGFATFSFGAMAMHAPLPYGTQLVFTLFATGWLVICSIICGLAARADRNDDCAVGRPA